MYDVIIIGAGPAGLSAAIYSRRFLMKTLVIGRLIGGLITTTNYIENWPGEKKISGIELMKKLEQHARSLGAEFLQDEVKTIKKLKNSFVIETGKESYETKTIILATGTIHKRLGIKGEGEYYNKGVSYCASCDAPLFRTRTVGVVGGSDSAVKEAILLSQYAKKIYIIYRKDKLRAEPVTLDVLSKAVNIELILNTNLTEIKGSGKRVTSVMLDNGKELPLDGLFIEIGLTPQNELARVLNVKLNDKDEIITDKTGNTSIKGIFAAGDCIDYPFKQAILAAGEGVNAAFNAHEFIKSQV